MKNIFSNRLVRNIITLVQGNLLVSIIGLINMMILVRGIGLEKNGMIFMAQTYANLFNDIFNFQSFNAIIKFVPPNIKDNNKVMAYIKQGLNLDVLTAIIGAIIGFVAIIPISIIMKWDSNMVIYVSIYVFTILFRITGTATGVLRVFEKFKSTVYVNLFEAIVRSMLYIFGIINKMNLLYFVVVDLVITFFTMVLLNYFAYRILKEKKLNKFLSNKIKSDKEFLKFNIYSNLQTSLDLPVWHLTPFIINSYLGFSDIAVYKIIEKIGNIVSKITIPISTAIHPYISKSIAAGEVKKVFKIHKKLRNTTIISGTIFIFIIYISHNIWLDFIIPSTNKNLLALLLYLLYLTLTNAFIVQHAIFIYLGYIKYTIPILIVGNTIYIILLYILTIKFGLIGIMTARILQSGLICVLKSVILKFNKNMCGR